WDDFRENPRQILFEGIRTGQEVSLVVKREGQNLTIPWMLPGPNSPEFRDRLINIWWLGYIFWLVGTVALLVVRPKDTRWKLFVAFNYLTAVWLVVGSISRWQVWWSAILFPAAIWICVPVYLHLHWIFPKPFRRIPKPFLAGVYLAGIGLATAEFFQFLPRGTFYFGLFLALGGTTVLLALHFIVQPTQRREVGLLTAAVVLAILPAIGISIVEIFNVNPIQGGGGGTLLAMLILPIAYFYSIYRHHLGGLEARTNRIVSTYAYFILLGTGFIILIPLVNAWFGLSDAPVFGGVLAPLLAAFITVFWYPRFTRWAEHHVMGIPLPPTHLLEIYTDRITTSLDRSTLVGLLKDEILPSLLIRQSTLLRLDENNRLYRKYSVGIEEDELPKNSDLPVLLDQPLRSLPFQEIPEPLSWIRLALPLKVSAKTIGIWLLGSKDPDDIYTQGEISVLQSIANQTAIALVNIDQAERLHTFYQANIDRHEEKRTSLARELHDDVLNQMAAMFMKMIPDETSGLQEGYNLVTTRLRSMITSLRPTMLNYGLWTALDEFTDELSERAESGISIVLNIPSSEARYEPKIEEHIYRIVQQACENALRHAQAGTIRVNGTLEPEHVKLIIEDDGIGFSFEWLDFDTLLTHRHFGLAGMFERADLIGAELKFDSASGKGTRVFVSWSLNKVALMPRPGLA
ncbi:MAG: hypothetical protein KJ638_10020, partial [Chloroflexi bacterium]|nr:hypothetical protein [Chloroflexota bacterium]